MIDPRLEAARVLRKAEEVTNDPIDLRNIAEAYIRLGEALIYEEADKDVPMAPPEEPKTECCPGVEDACGGCYEPPTEEPNPENVFIRMTKPMSEDDIKDVARQIVLRFLKS